METHFLTQEFCRSYELYSVFPLIQLLIGSIVPALTGGFFYWRTKVKGIEKKKLKEKGICILGPESSGKTQLLCGLRDKPYEQIQNQIEPYDEFTINLSGENIKVLAGNDIAGVDFMIRTTWPKLIEKSNLVFFIFDAYRYLNDKEYRIYQVNSRLFWIYMHKGDKTLVTFGSHFDEFKKKSPKDIIKKIQDSIKNSYYSTMLECNFFVVDLRDAETVKKYLEKNIFLG